MDTIENIKTRIESYNSLIKYQIKANRENVAGERKINLSIDGMLPDINSLKSEVLHTLRNGDYSDEFIHSINRLYLLSEANSDLLVEYTPAITNLYKDYPISKELDKLSLDIFHFIHFDILQAKDQIGRPIIYKGFEDTNDDLPEYRFKDNAYILWNLYYLSLNVSEAYLKQELKDFENLLSYKLEADKELFIEQQKDKRAGNILELSRDFCDRDLPFLYLRSNPLINKTNLVCLILSDVMEKLSIDEYPRYVEFDYSVYTTKFRWEFEKNSLNDYSDIASLPRFDQLIYLFSNIFFIEKIGKQIKEEQITLISYEPIENMEEMEAYLDKKDLEQEQIEPGLSKNTKAEYLLAVPILNLIYEEFDGEVWETISLVDFLNVFTTAINLQQNFKIRQKTRFYYLLKKVWINSLNLSLFDTEKEWSETFLNNYNLSVSAYWNQTVKNEGTLKNRAFVQSVDKILPKDERF